MPKDEPYGGSNIVIAVPDFAETDFLLTKLEGQLKSLQSSGANVAQKAEMLNLVTSSLTKVFEQVSAVIPMIGKSILVSPGASVANALSQVQTLANKGMGVLELLSKIT